MALLSAKKKAKTKAAPPAKKAAPPAKKAVVPPREVYEPSHFVWLKANGRVQRQPALVLWGEKNGVIVLYVTPTGDGDTGRREVPYNAIEGRING